MAYGETPAYTGETPTKKADAQYTYTFEGWTPEIKPVTGEATYTATYSSTVNEYTIKFVDEDGTELQSSDVAYGETPAYTGETPTKAADAQYTYTFAGWDPEVVAVTGDATYTATYSSTVNEYTIKFVNEDGTELQSGNVAYGETPAYTGETPTKAATAQYTYTFAGWTPEVVAVTGDATYTATYSSTVNEYTIKFVNEDGTELQSSSVAYGETPAYTGETPTKAADAQYTYTFVGWDPEVVAVTGDATYTATYSSTVNEYTIKFVNEDGTELQSSSVAYGETPAYTGETPTKAADAQYTYTFAGWDPEVVAVTGDATYTATYSSTVNEYTIKFVNEDGTELQSGNVAYGETPAYTGETPTKAATAQYTYTFAGWTPEVVAVTGDATYTATYSSTVNEYTIKFVNEDGTELQSSSVAYGETPAYTGETPTKAADAQYTYTFAGWDPEVVAVTGEATYTAQFSSTVNKYSYTIHHYLLGTTTSVADDQSFTVDYGTEVTVTPVTTYQEMNLTVDSYNPTQTVTIKGAGTVITVYYTLPLTIVPNAGTKVYGSAEPTLSANVTGKLTEDTVTYTVSRVAGEPVGDYRITVSNVNAPEYYVVDADAVANFEITPKTVTVTADNQVRTNRPGEEDPELTWKAEGLVEGEDETVLTVTVAREEGTAPGTYVITPKGEKEQGNYIVTYTTGTMTIQDASNNLYNYISFDGGKNYISLNTGKIVVSESASKADIGAVIATDDYDADGYTFSGYKWVKPVDGNNDYVKQILFKYIDDAVESAAYFTVDLDKIVAADSASYKTSTQMTPETEAYADVQGERIYVRYYKATLVTPFEPQALYTAINFNNTWLGVEYRENVDIINSRLVPFNYKLKTGDYSGIEEFDFTGQNIKKDGVTYKYNDKTADAYYTVNEGVIDKEYHTDVSGGWLNDEVKKAWQHKATKSQGAASGWKSAPDENGLYHAGYWRRNYTATLYYKVSFVDWDDSVISSAHYKLNTAANQVVKPQNPTREEDDLYTYEFAGWDKAIEKVTGTAVYKATYTATPKTAQYTIHHYLKGTTTPVADDETGTMNIGQTLTGTKAVGLGEEYVADSATTVTISQNNEENVSVVYYTVPLTVTAASASKEYDGTALTDSGITVNGLVNDDTADKFTATMTAGSTITNVGDPVENVIDQVYYDGKDVPAYYRVTKENGTLEITAKAVSINVTDSSKTYGETDPAFTGTVEGLVNDGDLGTITYSRTGNDEDVGTYDDVLTASYTANANYSVTVVPGDFEITAKAVTITVADASKTYGATDPAFTGTVEGLVNEGDLGEITYSRTGNDENVGTYDDVLTASYTENDNYTVTVVPGDFEITAKAVTITVAKAEKTYGATDPAFTGTVEGLANEGDLGEITYSRTNDAETVGTYEGVLTASYTANDNYTVTVVPGDFEIKAKAVTITVKDAEKTYNEKDPDFTGTVVGLVNEGDLGTITYSRTNDAENVGKYEGVLTASYTANANYTVTVVPGDFEIKAKVVTVTITGNTGKLTYNGAEQKIEEYVVEISDPLYTVNDFRFSGEAIAKGTDVGTYKMGLEADQFTNNNANFAVTFDVTDGGLEIEKKAVTVEANDKTKVYDNDPTTDPGLNATVNGAVEGETINYTLARAEGQEAGEYAITVTAGENPNYNVTVKGGTFSITKKAITIKANGKTKVYDNNETTDPELTATVTGVPTNGTAPVYSLSRVTGQDAGNYAISVTAEAESNPNYTVTTEGATFSITAKPVTITVNGAEKTYGEADPTFTGTVVGLIGQNDLGTVTYSRTNLNENNAGTYEKVLTASYTANDNYTVTIVPGNFTIKKVTGVVVTITGHNNTTDYDGAAHNVSGYDVDISNTLYTAADFTFSGSAAASRTDAGTTEMGLKAEQFANKNSNFEGVTFMVTDGYQTINPIDVTVTITGHNNTTDYDGTEHNVSGYDVDIKNPLYQEAYFTGPTTASAAQTNAGTSYMGLSEDSFTNTNNNFGTVTFEVTDGYQKINPIDVTVTITEHSGEADYDGKEHTVTGYDVTSIQINGEDTTLYTVDDFTFSGTASVSGTNAGTYDMELTEDDFTNDNTNFANVTFTIVNGQLKIKPIDMTVTITGQNSSVTYDGYEHSVSGYDVDISNPLYKEADFTFSGTAVAKRTNEGTTNMGLAAEQFTNKNNNFDTVTFNVTDGYQTIVPVEEVVVTITGHNNTTDYDGEEHSVSGYDVKISDPLYKETDFTFIPAEGMSDDLTITRIDAGTTMMGLAAAQFTNKNTNFAKVTFNVTDGYQTINKINATVTITGHSDEVDYDGEEHTVTGYDVEISNDLYTEADFTFSGTNSVSGTDAGSYDMELTADDFTNTNENFETVTFVIVDGQLVIDPIDVTVTITEHSDEVDYDGEEHTVTGYDVTSISNDLYTEADFAFSGDASVSGTNAGSYGMELTADDFTNTNDNFATVTFVVNDGELKIKPIDTIVKIVGNTNTTDYDGEAHTVTGYTATADSELYDVTKDFSFSGSAEAVRTDAGTTKMGLAASQFTNTNANFANVTFAVTDGEQTIAPIDVTVTIVGEKNTADYDGKAHTVTGYTATADSELYDVDKDFTFSGTQSATQTDAGTKKMGLAADQFTNTNSNFANVTFNVTDGYQTIDPIDVTVTIVGANNTADYNGAEHIVTGYTATTESTLYDVTKDFTFSGTAEAKRTDAGTTKMGLAAEQFENKNTNFAAVTFNVTDGYQTIDPINATVTITGATGTKTYDGKEYTASGYSATANTTLYDVDNDFTFSGTAEAKRTEAGTTQMELAEDQFTNINTNFANVTFEIKDGWQQIVPVDEVVVTITGHNSTVPYDGKEHKVEGYDVEFSNELYTEDDFTFSGKAEAAQTNADTAYMGLSEADFTNNSDNFTKVTFIVNDGYQKIEKINATVTITEHSGEFDYDGKQHTVTRYDVAIDNELYKEADFTFNGTASISGTNAGTYDMELKETDFNNTNPNFETVTFVIKNGQLVIKPIDVTVTITGKNDTRDYDGSEHKVSGYTAVANSDLYDVEKDFSFNGTDEASQTKAGTSNMGLTDKQFVNNNTNFKVSFEVKDGYQTINKVPVTVTANDKERTSHFAEKEEPELTVTISGLVNDEPESLILKLITLSREQGEKLHTPGEYEIKAEGPAETDNYTITYVSGKMTVTDVSDPLYNLAEINGKWYRLQRQENAIITEKPLSEYVKSLASEKQYTLKENEYELLKDYNFSEEIITLNGKEYVYSENGEPNPDHRTSNYYTVAPRTDYIVAVKGKISGWTDNWLIPENERYTDPENKDSFHRNYVITLYDAVTVVANGKETVYNGGIQSQKNGYKSYVTDLNGNRIEVKPNLDFHTYGEGKDVGEYTVAFTDYKYGKIVTSGNNRYFAAAFENGTLKITPKELTITAKSQKFTYNGKAQSNGKADIVGLKGTDKITPVVEGSITNVAESPVTNKLVSYEFTAGDAKNYTIKTADGQLTMLPKTVTITTGSASKVYDGTALTSGEAKITGLVGNQKATVTATGSITDPGNIDNTYSIDWGTTVSSNYTISENLGKLTVTPYENEITVTITERSGEALYDGAVHTVSGYDVTSIQVNGEDMTLYTAEDFTFSGNATISGTDASTYNMQLKPEDFTNTNENFTNVTFVIVDGKLTINPKPVTVTAKSDSFTYDGTAHSNNGYDVDGLVGDDAISAVVTGSITFPSESPVTNKLTSYEFTTGKAGNYKVTTVDGELTMAKAEKAITITAASDEWTYDGAAHANSSVTVTTGELFTGDELVATATGSVTNVADTAEGNNPIVEGYQIMHGEEDVSANYKITPVAGKLTINPKAVTVTAEGKEKVYDNDASTDPDLTADVDGAVEGETINYTLSREAGQNVGQYAITVTKGLNPNYTVTTKGGIFEIKPAEITITADNKTKAYDNDPATDPGLTATVTGVPTNGIAPNYSLSRVTGQDAGGYPITVTAPAASNPNYKVTVAGGTFTITPIDVTVTITEHSGTVDYDGEPHEVKGYDAVFSTELYTKNDFTFSGTDSVSGTIADTYEMKLNPEDFANINNNFAKVTFVIMDGTLVINPIDVTVTITGHKDTKTYDGKEHAVTGYDTEFSTKLYKATDFTFSGTAEAKRTLEGTTDMGLAAAQFANQNKNFKTVTFNVTDGAMTIVPKGDVVVTITERGGRFDYDGAAHTVTGYDVEISDPLYTTADFSFNGTATVSGTDAGTYGMELKPEDFTNTNPNFENVTFVIVDKQLVIDPIDVTVTITEHSGEYNYDGAAHTVTGYDVTSIQVKGEDTTLYTAADFTFSGNATVSGTDAKSYDMELKPEDFTNTNKNFANVTFVIVDGQLVIKPIEATVTITEHSGEFDYNGELRTVSGYEVTSIQVNGEDTTLYTANDFTFSGTDSISGINAGTYNMELKPGDFTNTNDNFSKVTFVIENGTLVIKPIGVTVTITEHGDKVSYDGNEHTVTGYDVAISNDLYKEADFTFNGTASISGTNAGTYDMELKASDFTNTNPNFANVDFEIVDGQLVIDPINVTVTITGANNTTDYDGAAHKVTGYTATADSKLYDVDNDIAFSGTAEASKTEAGTEYMSLAASQFSNTNPNFATVTFNVTDGYQTINQIDTTVTITGATGTTDYDGEEHTVTGYTATAESKLYDVKKDFTFSGEAEASKTDAGTEYMDLKAEQFTNTNPNFRNVTFVINDGWQKINPINATVTITGHYNSATYDSEEHIVTGYDTKFSTDLYSEADFTFSGNAEAKRTDNGTTWMGLKAEQFENKNANFKTVTFDVTDGYQEIVPVDEVVVTIIGRNSTLKYDGKEHGVEGYDVTISNDLYTTDDFTFNGTAEAARTDAGTTKMGLAEGQFVNTNTNFAKVTFKVTDGYQTIEKINATVTITEHSDTVDYDGEAHEVTGYDTAFSTDLYTANDFTFNGNATVSGTDAGTYEMKLKPEDFENKNANFDTVTFVIKDGALVIDPIDAEVTITGHTATAPYDSEEHEVTGYDVVSIQVKGENTTLYTTDDFTFSGDATAARTNKGTTYMNLADSQFRNTNKNFRTVTFNVTDGWQTITPIDVTVTITGHTDTKDYDGEAHDVTGYDVEISDPLYKESDFTFSGNAGATRTDAGTTYMGLTAEQFENINENFANVTFIVNDGWQTIDPIDVTVTITGHNDSVTFDGGEHSVSGYETAFSTPLYTAADFTFSGDDTAARRDIGTTNMGLAAEQFANINDNFATVTFEVIDGYQNITAKHVTVTANNKTKVYGDSDPALTATVTGLVGEDTIEYSLARAAGENIGTYTITPSGAAEQGNYEIEYVNGTLAITKATVTVTADDKSKNFGENDPALTAVVTGLKNGDNASVISYELNRTAGEEAGTYTITPSGAAEQGNYDVVYVNGTLTIYPIDVTVTITEHSATAEYDATAHTASGYDVAISDPLYTTADFTFSGTDRITATNVGTYDMNLKASDFTNTNANFKSVNFVIVDGKLTITPKAVRIIADDKSMIYGDREPALTAKVEGLAGSDIIAYTLSREPGKNVGTYAINVAYEKNPNYVIETVPGTFTIERRPVTVTASDKTKKFGTADPTLTSTISGLVSGDAKSTIAYTLSRTAGEDVGTYPITPAGEAIQGNYTVSYVPGTLTIVAEDAVVVTITANSGSYVYDGTEKDLSGYTVETSDPDYTEADFTFSGSSELKGTNAGTYKTAMRAKDFTNTNPNYTNVVFQVENGELEITKRSIVITSADATKAYDGTPLMNHSAEMTGDGFAEGEGATLTFTGRIVDEGKTDNTFTYDLTDGTLARNYEIETIFGTLTITPALKHTLTITYRIEDNGEYETVKVFKREYATGEKFLVATEPLTGYEADIDKVMGTMEDKDLEYVVTYRPLEFTLTVRFVSVVDGHEVADSVQMKLKSGDNYRVFAPTVAGYTALTDLVSGIMPASDRVVTVFYVPEGQEQNGIHAVEIEDYGTPLGVADSILGGGEIVE